jgi:uncharacterized damage-inducible protein DinB
MRNAFLISLFQHKAWCNRRLIEALRAAPEDVDRRQMAVVLFTLDHTSIVDQIFKAHLSGAAHRFASVIAERLPDLDGLGATLGETDAWYLDYAGRVSPAELETVVDFTFVADGDQGRMTKGQMLAHVIQPSRGHVSEQAAKSGSTAQRPTALARSPEGMRGSFARAHGPAPRYRNPVGL